jgi:hypothetical protein
MQETVPRTSRKANAAVAEGGSRAALGLDFQANVTAFALTHLISGQRLGGLDPQLDQVPVAVASESGGPGDDIRIELADGSIVEVQVKRGLTRGPRLWEPLDALALGLHEGAANFGLLIACPNASRPIRTHLARDLERIGSGRIDALSDIGEAWLARLAERRIPAAVCARMRIQVLAATNVAADAVRLAQAQLRGLLADPSQSGAAWTAVAADAASMIAFRSRRTIETALLALSARGIALRGDDRHSAGAASLQQLCKCVGEANASYSIVGLPKPLSIDASWLAQTARILADPLSEDEQFSDALGRYRGDGAPEGSNDRKSVHAATIGRFVAPSVVLAGPGMGKTTLLTKLAHGYSADGLPVLKVRLRVLVERMRSQGCGFEEGLFALGCDSSGLSPGAVRRAGFTQWVVLCDGLDECGLDRARIAEDLAVFARVHPAYRVVVTSRTIGYEAGALAAWRHYALDPLKHNKLATSIRSILQGMAFAEDRAQRVAAILESSPAIKTIAASPLLLGLATALALNRGSVGRTEADLYQDIFALVETAAVARARSSGLSSTEITRAIDLIGNELVLGDAEPAAQTLDRTAERFAVDFGCTMLEARRRCELALAYWCDVGLVERIHHQGTQMLAFVHKTFGEFACARFIQGESADRQRALIERAVALQADPVLDFAASLGLAELGFAVLLKSEPTWNQGAIIRALVLLNHARASDVQSVIRPLLERAYDLLRSASDDDLDRLGAAIIAVVPEHRKSLVDVATARTEDSSRAVRLVAWICLLQGNVALENREKLYAFARELTLPPESRDARAHLLGGIRLRPPVPKMLEMFAIRLGESLLVPRDAEMDALVTALYKHPGLSTSGFVIEVERLVERLDRDDFYRELRPHWYGHPKGLNLPDVDFKAFEAATSECEIAHLAALAGEAEADPRIAALPILPQLSAFVQITDYGGVHAGDVWHWGRPGWRSVEREVLGATVRLGVVDPERIAVEAASLLDKRDELRGHYSYVLLRKTAAVDLPPIDWAAARYLNLDTWKLEQALYHGSEFLLELAVKLLDPLLEDEGERRALVERVLADGQGDALWGVAELAKKLPTSVAVPLTLERLRRDPGKGAEYLFNIIEHHSPPLDADLETVLRDSLTTPNPRVAIGAARIIPLTGLGTTLRAALFEAIDGWANNPPPKPRIGQSPDPRDEIAKTLVKTATLTDEELVTLLPYRDDAVRDVAVARWKEKGSFRTLLLARAEAGELSGHQLSPFLSVPAAIDPQQRNAIMRLGSDDNPRMRRAILLPFDWPGFLDAKTRPLLEALAHDREPEIAALAGVLLENAPALA